MPLYEYECASCKHRWDDSYTIANRDEPLGKPCPKCGEKSVQKNVGSAAVIDPFLLGLHKPSSSFKEIMKNVIDTSSPRVKKNLRGKYE